MGCSHSDKVRGAFPAAVRRIVYRGGKPSPPRDFGIADREPFPALPRESWAKYRDRFEGATRLVMERINALVDDEYRQPPPLTGRLFSFPRQAFRGFSLRLLPFSALPFPPYLRAVLSCLRGFLLVILFFE